MTSNITDAFPPLARLAGQLGLKPDELMRLITRVEVHTAYGPSIELDDPFEPGPPNPYLQKLKPRIVFYVGDYPIAMQPYGAPGPTKWPEIEGALKIGGALAAAALVWWFFLR